MFCKKFWFKCKQCRPWSDAAICGVWSGSSLFAITLSGIKLHILCSKKIRSILRYKNEISQYHGNIANHRTSLGKIITVYVCDRHRTDPMITFTIQYFGILIHFGKMCGIWYVIDDIRLRYISRITKTVTFNCLSRFQTPNFCIAACQRNVQILSITYTQVISKQRLSFKYIFYTFFFND